MKTTSTIDKNTHQKFLNRLNEKVATGSSYLSFCGKRAEKPIAEVLETSPLSDGTTSGWKPLNAALCVSLHTGDFKPMYPESTGDYAKCF